MSRSSTSRWQVETEGYLPRISAALDVVKGAWKPLANVPPGPLDFKPTREQQLAIQLMIFNLGAVRAVEQLYDTFGLLWSQGRFVGISMPVRLAMEFWGAVRFGSVILLDFREDGDLERAVERCARLSTGARSPVRLPQGGFTEAPSYNLYVALKSQSLAYLPLTSSFVRLVIQTSSRTRIFSWQARRTTIGAMMCSGNMSTLCWSARLPLPSRRPKDWSTKRIGL